MMHLARSQEEIDEQMNRAADGMDKGSKTPGMSYEEGVHAALMWVTGQSEEEPVEADEDAEADELAGFST